MRAVLGIDAAWTANEPSGIALIAERDGAWRSLVVAPSYQSFLALAEGAAVDWNARHAGERPDPERLLAACVKFSGVRPALVAVDMPLATLPITARRIADDDASVAFGRFGCAVHSPSAVRPGPIADAMKEAFESKGFSLAVKGAPLGRTPALLEVYPHAAILRLMALTFRLPFKVSKSGKFWRNETPKPDVAERIRRLLENFSLLKAALDREIDGIALPLPQPGAIRHLARLKPYEDALDALVCAWVGAQYLAGRAEAYGDETAAIWVPKASAAL